ncbi:dnaK protein [Histomonas meleagridis]|uniref:dnaK protein n=1 Tax=Histomonas meleagridis TaxID=135588 RepID=UPI00355A514E|nr:dnaK protein [Histomonas meleagridis]KAH0806796.1 dnaK protein [Histomonas meleagridis]
MEKIPNYISFWDKYDKSRKLRPNTPIDNVIWQFGKEAQDSIIRYPDSIIQGNTFNNKRYYDYIYGYEITALKLLQILKKVKEIERIKDQIDVVISIPPSTSAIEKSFLYSALSIAKINSIQFVPTTFASSALYGHERHKTHQNKIIGFFDVGSKGIRFTISKFTRDSVEEITSFFDESFGGKNVDEKLVDLLSNRYSFDLRSSRDYETFLELTRKAKETLTVTTATTFSFKDRTIKVNRKDLDSVFGEIYQFLYDVRLSCTNLGIRLDSIELVGDGSRSPLISTYIKDTFGISPQRSLDSISANAMGACYVGCFQKGVCCSSGNRNLKLISKLTNGCTLSSSYITDYPIFERGDIESNERNLQLQIHPNEIFHIVDKTTGEEFIRFTIPVTYSQERSITFMTNYFLMPVPQCNDIHYENIGWELSPTKITQSNKVINSLINNMNDNLQRGKIYNDFDSDLIKARNYANSHGFSFKGIILNLMIEYYSSWLEKAGKEHKNVETIKRKNNEFKNLYSLFKSGGIESKEDFERKRLEERFNTWLTTCETLGCQTYDVKRWKEKEFRRASNDEIRKVIRKMKDRAIRAQEEYL